MSVTVERDRDYGWAVRPGPVKWRAGGWDVRRGRKYIGCILLQRDGRLDATVLGSPRHYSTRVPTVAAGVRWIELRAPR